MRKSSRKHRLISRAANEIFSDDPVELPGTSTDASAVVASQLGIPSPRRDKKSMRSSVLFSDKNEKQVHESADHLVQHNTSTAVSEDFELLMGDLYKFKYIPLMFQEKKKKQLH